MSSMRNAVQRRNHKERAQPLEREKWGVLEKHKDYALRAKDYNEKKKRLKILRQKAAERNPDEFHFAMMSSKTHDKGQKFADRGNLVLSQDAVKLLKTQDAGYLKTMAQKTRRARERLEHEYILREGKSVKVLGDGGDSDEPQHTVFVDSREEQIRFDAKGFFATTADGLGRHFNRPRNDHNDPQTGEEKVDSKLLAFKKHDEAGRALRVAERKELALKQDRISRKQHKREQEARASKLELLEAREKDFLAAEHELELQRAKMSNSVGGVTKTGVKWKVRERKRFPGFYVGLSGSSSLVMKIEGRTFIVSGGASGLGRATVRNIVQVGGYVAILDMNEEGGQALVEEIGDGRAKYFPVDVSNTESIAEAVKDTLSWAKQTGKEVGGVIAAAGISNPAKIIDKHGDPFDLKEFDFVMNINVRGSIDLVRQVLPHLSTVEPAPPDGERGVIILVSSSAAFEGQPGQVAYSASKGALASLTLPLTRDLARYGIRVVTIAPSLFDSGMTALMSDKVRSSLTRVMEFPLRPGKPEEFARIVREGLENSMLNGAVLRLDGGMRMPSKM